MSPRPSKAKKLIFCIRGFTIVEVMVVVAILGILGSIALPSFLNSIHQRAVANLAVDMANDIQMAKSEALKSRTNVQFVVANDNSGHQVVSNPGASQVQLKSVAYSSYSSVTVAANGSRTITFSGTFNRPAEALTNSDYFTASRGSANLRVQVNPAGLVTICGGFGGHPSC